MKTKILISLVAILFVSVLYFLYLNFTKKPEVVYVPQTGKITLPNTVPTVSQQTADWKTYTNKTYGFSFQYPSTSTVSSHTYTGYLASFIINKISPTDQYTDITFYVGNTDESLKIDRTDKNITVKDITISGLNAMQVSMPLGQNPAQELVYFSNNGKYFSFQFVGDTKGTVALNNFSQILSTFKFTDSTANTNKLETYTDINYGFQLSYPSNWKRINLSPESTEFTIQSPQGELIHATPFNNVNYDNSKDSSTVKNIQLKNGKTLLLTYVECDGEGCGFGKLELNTFSEIISSIKLL